MVHGSHIELAGNGRSGDQAEREESSEGVFTGSALVTIIFSENRGRLVQRGGSYFAWCLCDSTSG
jgi:hypothetical protein